MGAQAGSRCFGSASVSRRAAPVTRTGWEGEGCAASWMEGCVQFPPASDPAGVGLSELQCKWPKSFLDDSLW